MVLDAPLVEILPIKEGLRLAFPLRRSNFIIESDCLSAIDQINRKCEVDFQVECWIEDIRVMTEEFSFIGFKFCNGVGLIE